MLSVFKTYGQSKKKFSTLTGIRRVHSPPSPASFVSPEIVEINEQGPFGGSFPEDRAPSFERSAAVAASAASPQLQLEFDAGEPLFPPSILSQTQPGNRTPPRRNVSLPNGGKNVAEGSSSGSRARGPGSEDNTIWEEPLQPNRLQVDTSVQNARNFEDISESSAAHSIRKPTPSPIKIPNNSTSAKIRVQSSAEESADGNKNVPPPLPTKSSRPPSPSSAITDDISSAVSGTSMARALVATSFVLSNESRASKYKSGMTRQDSATLPRGEHPLINSPYMRERRASSGEPGSARSSSVPPVPRLPSRAELGLSIDGASGYKSQRNSVSLILDSGESGQLVPPPQLKRPKSTGRLCMEQTISMPPISPISEASSPAPSVPETPGPAVLGTTNVSDASSRSLANSLAQQRGLNLSEGNTSSSSLGTEASNHARAATEPGGAYSSAGERRPSNASKPKGTLAPGFDRTGGAMPGTMRSSGAFAVTNGRLTVTRTASESGVSRGQTSGPSRPAVLLPIGERPSSVLVPPSPQPSVASNVAAPTPTSTRVGPILLAAETPVDSPDLLDSFPLQIARERSAGPPPPLPLGRRSEENNSIPTPLQSSSGESMSGASMNRQTFPETPNAFSPLWSSTFASPPTSAPRSSIDQSLVGRNGSMMRVSGLIDTTRMAPRGGRTIFSKPSTRASRVPPTPPLTGESTNESQPDSPVLEDAPVPLAIKRLTAIEEQVASRSVSQYSTIPEPPTSGAQWGSEAFLMQQLQQQQMQQAKQQAGKPRGGRERSESVSAHSRDGSVAASQAQSQTTQTSSNQSAAAQAKAEEASSHRRMRSVTNPDEPLASPPPSYPATFEPIPLLHPRTGTADSSEQSNRSSIQSSSTHLQASSSSQSSVPQKRSLSPFPSPPPSSIPLPPSPGRSRLDAHASSISVEQPPPPYMEMLRGSTPPVPPMPTPPTPPAQSPAPNSRFVLSDPPAPPSTPSRATFTPDSTPSKRLPRTRPPLPHGPRAPSLSSAAARMRAGSVSSLSSNVAGGSSRMISMASHTAPRFQPSRVNFRGLTMEAAQWTLTSQQLQHIVSTAIRQSADASAIRILPQETLEDELPTEMERLEARAAELKTNYKLVVRRRNASLATLARIAEGTEHVEPGTATRVAEELSDLNETLDQTAEELYTVTDQLGQLARLRDLHQRSALAMALRKLNNSFLKQVGEVQRLRDMVDTLEAERDEAWQEAQEVAQEFDDYTERIMVEPSPSSRDATPSRRSSRVMIARKNSQRASKAGLRSSMYRRSQRSSTTSSHRYSGAASPGAWAPPGNSEDIPPVPPIPLRSDLIRFPSGDLPTRSSMDSPSSELRAMIQAQKELCEMLGISLEELKITHQPSRRQSMSALPGAKSPVSAAPTRRNSDIVTPNHQRSFKAFLTKHRLQTLMT
ncbi:hypothetical protein TRAPUB_12788 [Trametes pubescens]|uniref:Uncharacterized protein n=1 Tax=Trametes pubescens TaxID=154538 RepID=A0A1M2VSY0_TRAPU|nr:hypothetical protein TRAPUB_12788 [Trametes pubescens]